MIKAIAIDDEPIALAVIANFCKEIDFINLEKTFEDSKDGLKYLNKFPADLLFLDIDMPALNGIDLFKKQKQDAMVIFTTAKANYAVEGFNLMAVDFLVKPFTFERFKQAVNRANDYYRFKTNKISPDEQKFLFIRVDFNLIKIPFVDISYIEAFDDYLKIHVDNQKTPVVRMTMKAILEKLPENDFVRAHRSFIVATKRIKAVTAKHVIVDEHQIPLGGSYAELILKHFTK